MPFSRISPGHRAQHQSQQHQHHIPGQLELIMKIGPLPDACRTHWIRGLTASGPLPDAVDPGFQCVRTHWIQGFIAFQLARRTRTMRLMVPAGPESGFSGEPPGRRPFARRRSAGTT